MTNRNLDTSVNRTRSARFLVRVQSRWHDGPLTARSIFLVSNGRTPDDSPLRLIVPVAAASVEPLIHLARESLPDVRQVEWLTDLSGPDAEAALMERWDAMSAVERARVRGVVSPLAGTLARFRDRRTLGFALLSATSSDPDQPANSQSRALLMASVSDSWSLAIDDGPGVDADTWRSRLRAVIASRWRVARLEEPDTIETTFHDALELGRQDPASPPPRQAIPAGSPSGPVGWLDVELHAWLSASGAGGDVERLTNREAFSGPAGKDLSLKVVRGQRGRLFLTRDSHDSHQQMLGRRRLSAAELDAWAVGTASRTSDISAAGARFVQLIGPAPQAVHPADLPTGEIVAADRPARQVLERLSTLQPPPDVLYPVDALTDIKGFRDPFSKTDSHWNDLGAFLAYEALLDQVHGAVPLRRLLRTDVAFHETCYIGDLGSKLVPERASIFLRARVLPARARIVSDNMVRNHGRSAVFSCEAAPPSTCIVFGDSWAYSLMLFLAESFRRLVFYHRVNVVDREPILREKPDVVISVMTERFCTALPLDRDATPFDDVAARKIASGDLVPEPEPGSRHPFLFSLALERGLPLSGGLHLPPRSDLVGGGTLGAAEEPQA